MLALLLAGLVVMVLVPAWSAQAAMWVGTVSLTVDRSQADVNDRVVVFTVMLSSPRVSPYSVSVYDDTGARVWCTSTSAGPTFGLSVSTRVNSVRSYTGYVAQGCPTTGPPTVDVRAVSGSVTVTNVGWVGSVSLSAARPVVDAADPFVTLQLAFAPQLANPYGVGVYDDTGKRLYFVTSSTFGGSLTVKVPVNTTRTFTAYVAQDWADPGPPTSDVRATSSVSVTNVGYTGTVTLDVDRHQVDAGTPQAQLTVTESAGLGSWYSVSVYDELGRRVYYRGQAVTGGSLTVTLPANTTREYTAYVAQDAPSTGPPAVDVRAISAPVWVTSIPAGQHIEGMSLALLESAAIARFGSIENACLELGRFLTSTAVLLSSVPDATLTCTAGGAAAVAALLAGVGVSTATQAGALWQWGYGGDPGVVTEPDPVDPDPPTPLPVPPPVGASADTDRPLIASLTRRLLWRLLNVGTGPVPDRRPDAAAVKAIATQCLQLARVGGASASDCADETIFVPGTDAWGAALNDQQAIATGRPWRLHYVASAQQELPPQWWTYAAYSWPGCDYQSPEYVSGVVQCDEYPFYTTNEAGPSNPANAAGARLEFVAMSENGAEGSALRWMPSHCGFTSGAASPGQPGVLGSHYLVVPLPEIVPVTTYICGSDVDAG